MSTIDDLVAREKKTFDEITSINDALRYHRFVGATQQNNLLFRLARAEAAYKAIYAQLLKLGASAQYALYQKQLPARRNGLDVTVELSLDGFAFSNPAPAVPHNATIYVRARIEENHTGVLGVPKSHLIYRLSWRYHSSYHPLDGVSKYGHDEYVVSNPLVVTRVFKAPATGTTKHNFFCYVDSYEPVG